ncbi:MAG: IS4 family transposase [Desulfobacterales bacterium]|nr:IS4 family transposase [Desulfobacterales bacterium]
MKSSPVLKRFFEKSPIPVIARGMIERLLNPAQLDKWFDKISKSQYTRELLFSTIFDIMSHVVLGSRKSVNAAYMASKEDISVSITSVYNKLNCIEKNTSAELVRYAAREAKPIIEALGPQEPLIAGFRIKILDGNCIEAVEHRLKELRFVSSGALPGKSLVVFDPVLRMPIDVFPCEDGHAQERSLLSAVIPTVEAGDLWISDRNFCVRSFIFGIAAKKAFSITRLHGNLPFEILGKEKPAGKIETGKVTEQRIEVVDELGEKRQFRLVRVYLKKKTRDGDMQIAIITDLPKVSASARLVAELYRSRWKIETSFQEMEKFWNSEINSLGYPPAALFGFCVALVSHIILAVVKAALCSAHGNDIVDNRLSGYYVADEISGTYRGMQVAIEEKEWKLFQTASQAEVIKLLKQLAANVKISSFLKSPRGPKKPVVKQKPDPKHPHVSIAKLLAGRKI